MAQEPLHQTKTCTKCGAEKPATAEFFHKRGAGLKMPCKPCRSATRRATYAANPEREKASNAAWAAANPDRAKDRQRKWRAANPGREASLHRQWYASNSERVADNGRNWRSANPEKAAKIAREYTARRRRNDPQFRLQRAVSRAVNKCLNGDKGSRHTFDLLGYDAAALKAHLERGFQRGMTWENYGSAWHVDHCLAQSSFTFRTASDAEFRACWALSNLRPLWAVDNMKKSNRRVYLI